MIGIVLLALLQLGAAQSCNPPATADSFLLQCGCTTEALQQVKEDLKKEIASLEDEIIEAQKQEVASLKEEILENLRTLQSCHGLECVCKNRLGKTIECPADSCKDIIDEQSENPSGYYWLKACEICEPFQAFCDFNLTFEGTRGWMRVADLDMTDHSQQCPSQFRLITSPKRVCGKINDGFGCDSTFFDTYAIRYSKVAGKAIGYGHHSPDGFDRYDHCPGGCSINQPYVDGISITHGYPRNHIWTYAGGKHTNNCPCATGSTQNMPAYIGNDYYCEVGTDTSDPLWDGEGCSGTEAPCCLRVRQRSGWFIRRLNAPTTDDIEVRLCVDEIFANEDVRMERIELYIQ